MIIVPSHTYSSQHAPHPQPDGLLQAKGGLQPCLLIDSSTILPIYTAELAQRVAAMKLAPDSTSLLMTAGGGGGDQQQASPSFVDAPVSGGVPGAVAASLTFMCGGTPEAVAAATPYLRCMGKHVVHLGKAGLGQVGV